MGLKGDDILIVSGGYSNAPYETAPKILVHFTSERAVKAQTRLCICVSLSKTLYFLLSTASTKEMFGNDLKTVDGDVKHQPKQTKLISIGHLIHFFYHITSRLGLI